MKRAHIRVVQRREPGSSTSASVAAANEMGGTWKIRGTVQRNAPAIRERTPQPDAPAVTLTCNQLRALVCEAVMSVVGPQAKPANGLLTTRELAEHIGVDARTITGWASHKGLPHRRVGNLYRFEQHAVDAWFERTGRGVSGNQSSRRRRRDGEA